ncbi:MAG: intradiol ring-cleavage dioxygenase [Gemmatimonadales bacterium]
MLKDLHDDDSPVGRILTRREAVILLGGAGAAGFLTLAGCSSGKPVTVANAGTTAEAGTAATSASASCVAKPEMTEGPYFVDEKLNRSDIRTDSHTGAAKPGSPFVLAFNVSRINAGTCTALAGALVDVWHCDALGVYSDANDPTFNTKGQTWLRGSQVTGSSGVARFTTILPGWYPGRASHIHFKIRGNKSSGSAYDFTSQLFFTEPFLASAYAQAPYNTKSDSGRRLNDADGIYRQGGSELLVTPSGSSSGYAATLNIGLSV